MNIALFGGTFDPIHRGHLVVARAAAAKFQLKQVWFVPADIPPHKQKSPITSFDHRYAMVALGLAGEKEFLPSLLEAPDQAIPESKRKPSYSIETVRRVKKNAGQERPLILSDRDGCLPRHRQVVQGRRAVDGVRLHRGVAPGIFSGGRGIGASGKAASAPEVTKLFRKEAMDGTLVCAALRCICCRRRTRTSRPPRSARRSNRGGALKRLLPDFGG